MAYTSTRISIQPCFDKAGTVRSWDIVETPGKGASKTIVAGLTLAAVEAKIPGIVSKGLKAYDLVRYEIQDDKGTTVDAGYYDSQGIRHAEGAGTGKKPKGDSGKKPKGDSGTKPKVRAADAGVVVQVAAGKAGKTEKKATEKKATEKKATEKTGKTTTTGGKKPKVGQIPDLPAMPGEKDTKAAKGAKGAKGAKETEAAKAGKAGKAGKATVGVVVQAARGR